jgi:hypothetical protein
MHLTSSIALIQKHLANRSSLHLGNALISSLQYRDNLNVRKKSLHRRQMNASHGVLREESQEGTAIDEIHWWIDDFDSDSAMEEDSDCSSEKETGDTTKEDNPNQYVTCAVNEGDNLDEFESNDDLEGENDDPLIAVSNTGRPAITVKAKKAGEQKKIIGTHVLFNTHGRLLLRHENKLRGSPRQRNFLQRLVAVNKKHSVPFCCFGKDRCLQTCFILN